ncbi:TPA: hypothetical protein ACVU46_000647 [Vibrio parahaemolyticus]
MKKVALMHVISKEEVTFFNRFERSLMDKGLSVIYVTTSLYCFLLLRLKGKDVYISMKNKTSNNNYSLESYFNDKVGWLSKEKSNIAFFSMYELSNKLMSTYDVKVAFIPSGRLASHQGLTLACKELGVSTIFSGYGNFPGKTFFDKEGTDKNSTLYNNKNKLESSVFDEVAKLEFSNWKKAYLSKKLQKHVVSQAKNVTIKTYLSRLARIVFCKVENVMGVALDVDRSWRSVFEFSKVDYSHLSSPLPDKKFLFLPLQFSKDAQLILNYHGDVVSSMNQALDIAKEKDLALVIKPHPVDNSIDVYHSIKKFLEDNNASLSLDNTFKLIDMSELVVTVNSTVGLEAKIMNKDVTFLGESIYSDMRENHVYAYLFKYLVDIEYFSKTNITNSKLDEIFSICEVEL